MKALRVAAWLSAPLLAWAQPPAELSGLVADPSGGVVPGAAVSVTSDSSGFRRTVESQADGRFLVTSLQPGYYKVAVRKEGFRTVVRLGVGLEAGRRMRLDFTLPVGSVHETITVTDQSTDPGSSVFTPGLAVLREEIERLPSSGRGLLPLLELSPATIVTPATRGESGQFTVNGQRPNSHYFTLDGVSVNSGVSGGAAPAQATGGTLPGMTAFGSFHGLASLEALSEVRVHAGADEPESGRLPGVQIALASRSGGNEFHGSIFTYLRHERLDANDWFANRSGQGRAPLRLAHAGGAFGGPVRKDRLFFFASYERLRFRQPMFWRSSVPVPNTAGRAPAWARPLLALLPAPSGPHLGGDAAEWVARVVRPARFDAASLRVDYLATSRTSLFARYQLAPSYSEFGGWERNQLSLRSQTGTLGLILRLTSQWVVDLRGNLATASAGSDWLRADGSRLPDCYLTPVTALLTPWPNLCESYFRFSLAGVGTLSSGRESDTWQRQWNSVGTLDWSSRAHHLRAGADYRRLAPRRRTTGTAVSILSEGMGDLLADRNLWMAISKPELNSGLLEEWSAFLQDTWRIHPRLTAGFGVRWEFSPAPETSAFVFGIDNGGSPFRPAREVPLWPLRYGYLAPRFGLAWRLSKSGNTVLRAGAGLFYESSMSIATDLVNGGPFNVSQFGFPASHSTALAQMILGYGFEADLRLPLVWQWNLSVERALSRTDTISLGYAGSMGRDLLRREMGGPESNERVRVVMATNHGSSDYQALLLRYQRRFARYFQAQASYTWSHSIDTGSADGAVHWVGSGQAAMDRGSSDFDARHVLTGAFSLALPAGWSLDGMFRARTGFPLAVLRSEYNMGISFANVYRPDLVRNVPVWLPDEAAPAGRRLNRAAFGFPLVQGNLGRNAIGGFGMAQLDVGLQREVRLAERLTALLRVEAFNVLNQANLADPVRLLSSPLFGESPSMLNQMLGTGSPASGLAPALQIGGARSVQIALRLRF